MLALQSITRIHVSIWRSLWSMFTVMWLLLVASSMALATNQASTYPPIPQPLTYVNNYAQILQPKQQAQLEQYLVSFASQNKSAIVVVIKKTTGNIPISTYSFNLMNQWGIGDKQLQSGILLMISFDDRKAFIATGAGAEGALPDAVAATIIRNELIPNFKQAQYYQGINKSLHAIVVGLAGEYKVALGSNHRVTNDDFDEFPLPFILLFIIAILAIGIGSNFRAAKARVLARNQPQHPNTGSSAITKSIIFLAAIEALKMMGQSRRGGFNGNYGYGKSNFSDLGNSSRHSSGPSNFGGGGSRGGGAGGSW